MTLSFTAEEKEWLIKEPLNWHCADDAPIDIKESLSEKLDLLKREVEYQNAIVYDDSLRRMPVEEVYTILDERKHSNR